MGFSLHLKEFLPCLATLSGFNHNKLLVVDGTVVGFCLKLIKCVKQVDEIDNVAYPALVYFSVIYAAISVYNNKSFQGMGESML